VIAVIFSSTRTTEFEDEYRAVAATMEDMARRQPGFISVESVRDTRSRRGITVSYWLDMVSANAWKKVGEHLAAQRAGKDRFYSAYTVVVAQVTRSYDAAGSELEWHIA
jgi:heme-degrading monooxygenase HmoA